jgi:hypothetical protein
MQRVRIESAPIGSRGTGSTVSGLPSSVIVERPSVCAHYGLHPPQSFGLQRVMRSPCYSVGGCALPPRAARGTPLRQKPERPARPEVLDFAGKISGAVHHTRISVHRDRFRCHGQSACRDGHHRGRGHWRIGVVAVLVVVALLPRDSVTRVPTSAALRSTSCRDKGYLGGAMGLGTGEDTRLEWELKPVDCSVEQCQHAPVAGKVIDDDKAAEPASVTDNLLDVLGYALGLTPVVHQIERNAADGAHSAPLARRNIVPSDRVTSLRPRKHALGPQPAVRDQGSSADQ